MRLVWIGAERLRWRFAVALAILPPALGCAGHAGTMHDVRQSLRNGDLEEARARLADAGRGTDDLLFALEDGLLLFYAGDHELSNVRLGFADLRIDDLYTKSISRAALSLVTSDLILRFEPRGIETFLVNYYRALNYDYLHEPEEAWVEWRRLAFKLQFSREHGDQAYIDPPFFNYVVGLGLEADDRNEAYIAFRLSEAAYRNQDMLPPPELIDDLIRLAGRLGFSDHIDAYQRLYSDHIDRDSTTAYTRHNSIQDVGEVVILVEDGLVAPIGEVLAYVPILKRRADRLREDDENDGLRIEMAEMLAQEYAVGRYAEVTPSHADKAEIAYVLPLAFPVYGQGEPAFRSLRASVGSQSAFGRVVLDVSSLQEAAFNDRLLRIYAKTIARALIKYAASEALEAEAKEKHGETAGDVVGFLTNIVNVVTERADTRSWLGLPDRIWMARFLVPLGVHDVRIILEDQEVVPLESLEIRAGERTIVTARVF